MAAEPPNVKATWADPPKTHTGLYVAKWPGRIASLCLFCAVGAVLLFRGSIAFGVVPLLGMAFALAVISRKAQVQLTADTILIRSAAGRITFPKLQLMGIEERKGGAAFLIDRAGKRYAIPLFLDDRDILIAQLKEIADQNRGFLGPSPFLRLGS